jgi:hypothetical protein
MAILTVDRAVIRLLPHPILVIVTTLANCGTNVLDGHACPRLRIRFGIHDVKAKVLKCLRGRYHLGHNKDEYK